MLRFTRVFAALAISPLFALATLELAGCASQQGEGGKADQAKASQGAAKGDQGKAADQGKQGKQGKTDKVAFKAYKAKIPGSTVSYEMLPIKGGEFTIGSPDGEEGREKHEGPRRRVKIAPFWMGKFEVTWDEYELWQLDLDVRRRKALGKKANERDLKADAITRPTPPYTDMTFGMGQYGHPAISMTQLAAKHYCKWLSAKTGHYYRLPTEAEWEYACRAGTTTAYHFGDDAAKLGEYAWFADNSDEKYHKVGKKKPNPWGLYDMHGNVSEWCLDQFFEDSYAKRWPKGALVANPFVAPTKVYPRVARGGSWQDDVEMLRAANRIASNEDWKMQDPQIPQSVWYHTDAQFIGFRLVRPLKEPDAKTKTKLFAMTAEEKDKMRQGR